MSSPWVVPDAQAPLYLIRYASEHMRSDNLGLGWAQIKLAEVLETCFTRLCETLQMIKQGDTRITYGPYFLHPFAMALTRVKSLPVLPQDLDVFLTYVVLDLKLSLVTWSHPLGEYGVMELREGDIYLCPHGELGISKEPTDPHWLNLPIGQRPLPQGTLRLESYMTHPPTPIGFMVFGEDRKPLAVLTLAQVRDAYKQCVSMEQVRATARMGLNGPPTR